LREIDYLGLDFDTTLAQQTAAEYVFTTSAILFALETLRKAKSSRRQWISY